MYSRLQNLILLVAVVGWGVSLLGVVLPWSAAAAGLQGLGAGPLPDDPMLDYWLRMAGGGFSIVGALFAAILIAPRKYAVLLPLLAWLSLAEGIILLISGLRLGLPPFPFWADTAFCLGTGAGLLLVHPHVQKEQKLANPPCPNGTNRQMLTRFSIFILATVASWYGMMLTHEVGHCLGALATGGTVQGVDLPLWGFSLTAYRDNPHPLFVAWAGPVGGALIALLVMASVIRLKGRWRNLLLYFCGFCLIANGIYLGLGGFSQIGDCADLLRHGARLWQLLLFGIVATALGGYCWHRLGPAGDWFKK